MSAFAGIVLVGGLGVRSRSVFLRGPKSMALVGNRPFLEYLVSKLRLDGITNIILCVGYRRSEVQQHFQRGSKWGLEIRYSIEEELLGNAGAVKKAARMLDPAELFVFNGDSLVGLDLQAMWDFHHSRRAVATAALISSPRGNHYNQILTTKAGEISRFGENNHDTSLSGKSFASAGVYLLSRAFIDLIPESRPVSIEEEMFPKIAGSGLYGYVTDGYFIDINVPGDLARAQRELPMRLKA